MIRVAKESKRSPTQILQQAVDYFGPDGLGLEVKHWDAASVELHGGGGYVIVRIQPQRQKRMTAVEIESREWDYDTERFLGEI